MKSSFEEDVGKYLAPLKGSFAYKTMMEGHMDWRKYVPWVQELASAYRPVAGAIVLSSGCGSGAELMAFMAEGAKEGHGIEVDSRLERLARTRFREEGLESRVSISLYDGLRLPFPDNRFDIVSSIHVVEHVADIDMYFEELCRVVKPNGIIFLDIPNRYFTHEAHTGLAAIHYFPRKLRNCLAWLWLRILGSDASSEQTRLKLLALHDLNIPFPHTLMRMYRKQQRRYCLSLLDAFFHVYTDFRVPYEDLRRQLYLCVRRMTTFRMVIAKTGDR